MKDYLCAAGALPAGASTEWRAERIGPQEANGACHRPTRGADSAVCEVVFQTLAFFQNLARLARPARPACPRSRLSQ